MKGTGHQTRGSSTVIITQLVGEGDIVVITVHGRNLLIQFERHEFRDVAYVCRYLVLVSAILSHGHDVML